MTEDASADTPLHWPEDDSPPPDDGIPYGVGTPPPGAGVGVPGYEHNYGETGADTYTENRTDEDPENER
jgi:hypothetical protein